MDLKTYFKVYFYITLCSIWTQGSLWKSTSFCLEVVDTNSNHTELQLCNTSSSDLVCGDNESIAIENTIFQCITNGSQGCGSCGNDAVPCSEEKPIYILHEIYSACSYKNNCSIPTTMYNLEGNITAVTINVTYECVPDSDIFNICGSFNQTFNTNYQYLGKDGSSVDYDLCVCCITGLHSLSVKDFIIPYNDFPDCNSGNISLDGDILNCTEIINVDLQQRNASTIEIPGSNPYRLWLSIAACGEVEIKCSTVPTQQNATSTISSAGASFSNTVRPNTTDSTSSSTTTSSYGESSTTDNNSFNTETKNMTVPEPTQQALDAFPVLPISVAGAAFVVVVFISILVILWRRKNAKRNSQENGNSKARQRDFTNPTYVPESNEEICVTNTQVLASAFNNLEYAEPVDCARVHFNTELEFARSTSDEDYYSHMSTKPQSKPCPKAENYSHIKLTTQKPDMPKARPYAKVTADITKSGTCIAIAEEGRVGAFQNSDGGAAAQNLRPIDSTYDHLGNLSQPKRTHSKKRVVVKVKDNYSHVHLGANGRKHRKATGFSVDGYSHVKLNVHAKRKKKKKMVKEIVKNHEYYNIVKLEDENYDHVNK